MPNLRAIETFVKALEGGSIASAARQLGISPAAASQNIARLERELGTRLITRTTRSMALTEAGESYLARVAPVLDELEKAQSDLSLIHGELQGRLRIACMAAFGRHVLAPLLPAFAALHPRLELELLITDRHVDVLKEDVDISVRYRDVLEPGMSVRLLASVPRILCASPQYLQQHGRPQSAQDLLEHPCLLYRRERDGRLMRWPFMRDGQRTDPQQKIAAIGSDIDALVEFAAAGGGIAWAGSFIVHEEMRKGRLVPLALKPARKGQLQFEDAPLDFFACFKDRKYVPAKVRALVDYLLQELPQQPVLR
ncbi:MULTISPECIES: LysR family transcriptional regulator [Comamonas]|uniref:LysR family transcriptional regulator n=1 Tax=Comamonas thiooxydans TaxID=363952 RepID=A0A7V8RR31_9BURK|nr:MULTISPECIES: LysR family transcriptional regulator [Comamonas]BCX54242.1 LysR family transcriptional regulator [Comamonas testosteroni]ACY31931.1 transcriptional regulator, LysR family [Comamonas thiooxydans]EFI59133.1 transcriptional regulator, LysR family protein [Comamonas thiooxydans]KKI14974.1 LysR family transcriptional regulator [Comamonas thiooxydans]MDH1254197.1 LysR family transcriptional regulator [Comamonas thiooxydans]